MTGHPFHEVAIVGVFDTEQARALEGHDSRSITFAPGMGALADAGLGPRVQQLRGGCPNMQVDDAAMALCSGAGAGALFTDVLLLGREQP